MAEQLTAGLLRESALVYKASGQKSMPVIAQAHYFKLQLGF